MTVLRRTALLIWRPLVLISPVLPILIYFRGAWYGLREAYSLSMFLGIPAYIYLMNALILSTRLRILDRITGHDRVIFFHRQLAGLALFLALLHGLIKSRVFPLSLMPAPLGAAALGFVLAAGLGGALFFRNRSSKGGRKGPDYSRVKALHNLTVAGGLLAAVHVLLAASTGEQAGRMALMGLWGALAIGLWVRHKLIRPLILRGRGNKITAVERLSEDLRRICISREGVGDFKAGQFAYFRFPGSSVGGEEHPFTLSSAPGMGHLELTVKVLGDYTAGLEALKPGQPVLVDGPYGAFTAEGGRSLVFLAGGIGITPFVSILRDILPSSSRRILLIWSVREPASLVFNDEFLKAEKDHENFRYIPLLTGPAAAGHAHRRGRIDRQLLEVEAGEGMIRESLWYCCGPAAMMAEIGRMLRMMGVGKKRIRMENFSF